MERSSSLFGIKDNKSPQFKKGHKKVGGRKKGVPNKNTPRKEYQKLFHKNIDYTYQVFQKYLRMPWSEFVVLSKSSELVKLPIWEISAIRIIQSWLIEENISALHYLTKYIIGMPSKYLSSEAICLDYKSVKRRMKSYEENVSMDWLLRRTLAYVSNFEGNSNHLFHFVKASRLLMEMIHKRNQLEYARNNSYTAAQMEEVLKVFSDTLKHAFIDNPTKYEIAKAYFYERLEETMIYSHLEFMDAD
jgi:hypothetical protein